MLNLAQSGYWFWFYPVIHSRSHYLFWEILKVAFLNISPEGDATCRNPLYKVLRISPAYFLYLQKMAPNSGSENGLPGNKDKKLKICCYFLCCYYIKNVIWLLNTMVVGPSGHDFRQVLPLSFHRSLTPPLLSSIHEIAAARLVGDDDIFTLILSVLLS